MASLLGGLGIAVFSAPGKLSPVRAVTAPAKNSGGVGTVTPVAQPAASARH